MSFISKERFLELWKESIVEDKDYGSKTLYFEGCSNRLKKFLLENDHENGIIAADLSKGESLNK